MQKGPRGRAINLWSVKRVVQLARLDVHDFQRCRRFALAMGEGVVDDGLDAVAPEVDGLLRNLELYLVGTDGLADDVAGCHRHHLVFRLAAFFGDG